MIEDLKQMLTTGPIRITVNKHNKNPDGFLYKKNKASLGSLEVIVFSYIQVAGDKGNCFVALCTINGKKCTRNIPELQLLKGEIKVVGDNSHIKQPVQLLTSQWLFR
mgnify:CR=1 FL=1